MGAPDDRRYTSTHEWARAEGEEVVIGITAFAVEQLQDLVYIDLPEAGAAVKKGAPFGEIESVKAVSDLLAPVDGTVTAVNDALADDLEALVRDAYTEGWMLRVRPEGGADALQGLLSAADYDRAVAESDH